MFSFIFITTLFILYMLTNMSFGIDREARNKCQNKTSKFAISGCFSSPDDVPLYNNNRDQKSFCACMSRQEGLGHSFKKCCKRKAIKISNECNLNAKIKGQPKPCKRAVRKYFKCLDGKIPKKFTVCASLRTDSFQSRIKSSTKLIIVQSIIILISYAVAAN